MNKNILRRKIYDQLLEWKNSPIRSPLLLVGARQVGKTTILREFALKNSSRYIEINFWFDKNNKYKNIFKNNGSAIDIIEELKDLFSIDDFDPQNVCFFLDEIQECPEAYSSLKSFKEQYPELMVLSTGSYLQLFLKNQKLQKLPIGCVDEFHLRPLCFEEFLENTIPEIYKKYLNLDPNQFKITETLHSKIMEKLNEYIFTGGLPEIVNLYINSPKNMKTRHSIRQKQKNLLKQYTDDFQKYGKSVHIKKIDKLFQNIPFQLERNHEDTTKRFNYKELGKNANYNAFHWSFNYLEQAGLIIRSFIVSKKDLPFQVHEKIEQRNIFKCYYFDIGLLNAILNTPLDTILNNFGSYKGFIAENFIGQEIYMRQNQKLISYKKNNKGDAAKIEFLLTNNSGEIIPIEVKSSYKALKAKSLENFVKEFSSNKAFKFVPTRYHKSKEYTSIPLYMIGKILKEL
jgi:hypothetical protein